MKARTRTCHYSQRRSPEAPQGRLDNRGQIPGLARQSRRRKKKNGKWRVCVDFTDLNKACPKDSFPLPHIDRLVEATTGNKPMPFMDAFSGYN